MNAAEPRRIASALDAHDFLTSGRDRDLGVRVSRLWEADWRDRTAEALHDGMDRFTHLEALHDLIGKPPAMVRFYFERPQQPLTATAHYAHGRLRRHASEHAD